MEICVLKSSAALEEKKATSNYLMVSHNVKQLAKEVDLALFVDQGSVHLIKDPQEALRLYMEASEEGEFKHVR